MVGSKTISCIVLNCLNDLFVKERLIPSIKRTTEHLTDWDIEIIVVDNGPDQNFKMNWVLKTTSNLSEEIYAVGPDLCTTFPHKKFKIKSFLKEAPMIMEREKFWEIGGYDEEYYFGYEDLKLSNAIYNLGKKIKKVRINSLHFGGTSTVLITHNNETQTNTNNSATVTY